MRSTKDFIFEEDYVKPRGLSEASEQPIKNVMEKFFESLGIAADFNQEDIIKTWEELTGDLIKKLTSQRPKWRRAGAPKILRRPWR